MCAYCINYTQRAEEKYWNVNCVKSSSDFGANRGFFLMFLFQMCWRGEWSVWGFVRFSYFVDHFFTGFSTKEDKKEDFLLAGKKNKKKKYILKFIDEVEVEWNKFLWAMRWIQTMNFWKHLQIR